MKKLIIFAHFILLFIVLIGCAPNENIDDDNPYDNIKESGDYKITYHLSNDLDDKFTQFYDHKDLSTYPPRPVRKDHLFKGWYIDSNYQTKYTFGSEVLESFALYAKFEKPSSEELLFQELFDINSNIKLELDMEDSQWQKMEDDYNYYKSFGSKSPIYRYANSLTISVNDKVYYFEEVGVRMKGNTSRLNFYNSQDGYYNQIHLKFDFQETFDDEDDYGDEAKVWENTNDRKARKDRTFAGLEKLDIKWNKNYDQTYAREIYALDFFKQNNIAAQNVNTSKFLLTNNNENINMGVFYIYEVIDDIFIKRHFPEENDVGDLYKAGWTNIGANYTSNVSYGIEDENEGLFFNFDLKTNKKTSKHDNFKTLISNLNTNKTIDTLYKYFDVNYLINFEAVNYLVGNPDDIRNNYNNHYLYFRNDHKAIIIPYDYDRVLGINRDYNPSKNAMMEIGILNGDAVGNYNKQANPIYQIILRNELLSVMLVKNVKSLLNNEWFTYDHFKENYYDIVYEKHQNDTIPDIQFKNVDFDRLPFDLTRGTNNYDSIYSNVFIKTYFELKRKTANK